MDVDVVIIGAGPAGCAAAIACHKAGLQTLIVSKEGITDHSLSGKQQPSESIHPGVATLLSRLDAADCIEKASMGVYEGIQTGPHFSPLGSDEDGSPWLGTHINRSLFDAALLQTAAQAGINIIRNDAVIDFMQEQDWITGVRTSSGTEINSKYVIDASGHKRIGGKKLHFREVFYSPPLFTWSGVAAIGDAAHPVFENRFTKFIPSATGWTWLAPEPPHRCTWTRLAMKGKQSLDTPDELKQLPLLGTVKTANCRWRIFRPFCKEGIILCGDAAAIIDPAAGQGIVTALLSGMEAAKTVISCLLNPDDEPSYLLHYDNWLLQLYTHKVEKLKSYYVENGIRIF